MLRTKKAKEKFSFNQLLLGHFAKSTHMMRRRVPLLEKKSKRKKEDFTFVLFSLSPQNKWMCKTLTWPA